MSAKDYFLRIGPFTVHVATALTSVQGNLERCYESQSLPKPSHFADWHIHVDAVRNVRRLIRPQCQFWLDGRTIFKPLPLAQAPAFFEWGLNWCIAQTAHQFLQLHAAVVARDDFGAIFIGAPGAGKSTIAAILMQAGWRLLSDEFALVSTSAGDLTPLPRPVSVKDTSIPLLSELAPTFDFGTVMKDTRKGSVAHLKQPRDSVAHMGVRAIPRWLIFPRFDPGRRAELLPLTPGLAAIRAAEQSFNYTVLAQSGFDTLADLVSHCDCYEFFHNEPADTVRLMNALAEGD